MASKESTVARWQKIIEEQSHSGLPVLDYCEKHSISTSSFYKWKRELHEYKLPNDSAEFIPLVTSESSYPQRKRLQIRLGRWLDLSWQW